MEIKASIALLVIAFVAGSKAAPIVISASAAEADTEAESAISGAVHTDRRPGEVRRRTPQRRS